MAVTMMPADTKDLHSASQADEAVGACRFPTSNCQCTAVGQQFEKLGSLLDKHRAFEQARIRERPPLGNESSQEAQSNKKIEVFVALRQS